MRRWRERYEKEGYNGLLDRRGHSYGDDENAGGTGCEKDARWKSHKADFPTFAWKSRKRRGIPTFPQPDGRWLIRKTGHVMCYKNRTF
jgi:hypothetical protein